MPVLTIGRMAKLYGLHRSTLHEAVAKGLVSTGFDGKGQRVIDLAEMIRRYGEPSSLPTLPPYTSTPIPDSHPTLPPDTISSLLEELRLLREEVRGLRETMLLLEHKPAGIDGKPRDVIQKESEEGDGPTKVAKQDKTNQTDTPLTFANLLDML